MQLEHQNHGVICLKIEKYNSNNNLGLCADVLWCRHDPFFMDTINKQSARHFRFMFSGTWFCRHNQCLAQPRDSFAVFIMLLEPYQSYA